MSQLAPEIRRAHHDYGVLNEIKREMRQHLHQMMMDIRKKAAELTMVDDEQFVVDMALQFDPLNENSAVQDLFGDGFHAATEQLQRWEGFDPYSHVGELPSGAVLDADK